MNYRRIDKRQWTPINLAWLAGLAEGEGYIGKNKVFFRIRMTDEDVIRRCMMFCIGHIRGPVEGDVARNRKPIYEWTITRRQDFIEILLAIYSWLGIRRRAEIDGCFAVIDPNGNIRSEIVASCNT
jgi:hypothetical protein